MAEMSLAPIVKADERGVARYEALSRISNSIRALKNPHHLFEILVRELANVVPFDAMAEFDQSANIVQWHLSPAARPAERPLDETDEILPRLVFRTQEPIVVRTSDMRTELAAFVERMRDTGLASACAFPLTTAHRQFGSLVFASGLADAYPPEEIRFCALVADQIALALDDAINFQAAETDLQASRKAQERLELLLDLTNRVVSKLDLRAVLHEISVQVRRVMHCDGVGIELPGLEDGKVRIYVLDIGKSSAPIEEGREVRPDSPVTRAFQTGEPVVLSGEEIHRHRLLYQAGFQSLVHVPMRGRRGIVGVLSLGTYRENAFSQDDLPFLSQVANHVAIAIDNALAYDDVSDQKQMLALEKLYLEDEIRSELGFEEIVGGSEALRRVLEKIKTVAPTDSTVLIYGETGTGKELIARALHDLSARKSGPFVKLNCAAIPTGLLESEMFGHEKGAFTGAMMQRIGRFELANRGSMFLDEIGEIPLELQPKLLRVLQEREFERLGSSRTLHTDARLIAATNRDLAALVKEQRFRPDLFYRLNVFPVRVPPLRERQEDIPQLVRHFVQQFSRKQGKTINAIPAETMSTLARYPWPGNIRELQNVIERAVILTSGQTLSVPGEDLRTAGEAPVSAELSVTASPSCNMREALEKSEHAQILAALEKSDWKLAGPDGAAARLGLKRTTLQSRMRKYSIRISRTVT